ncbi:hypothetical protein ACVRZC_02805 [Streptococcus hyointestinalis]|uniref:Uncharacterized protein n=1 Tax=Streptococcus hyointestinalis TaxID=1337 RepID=A0A380KF47_9STRE|nr:hypothetical protein [Streptococcus hyointestinalis]SUN62897.1 Uncharacterised protein [Streptococcus hyointestinalis]
MKKKVILGLSTIAVMSVFFASSSFAVKAAAPTCTKPRHKENYNISVYKKVMAHYSKDEIREYFAMRQVNDNTIIIADKGGGFFTTEEGYPMSPVTVYVPGGGTKVMHFDNPDEAATVGQVKKALGVKD